MLNYKYYKYKKEEKALSINEKAEKLKSIYVFTSSIFIVIIGIFIFLDFTLFIHHFHFSYAVFKDFYLTAFDLSIANILILIALIPIFIALFIFYIPYMIVEILLKFKLSQFKALSINIGFVITFFIYYFAIGFIIYGLTSLIGWNNEIIFFIIIIEYIVILAISLFISISDAKYKIILYCILALIIIYSYVSLYNIFLLLISTLFMPFILLMFLESKKVESKSSENAIKILDIMIFIFLSLIITVIMFLWMNNDQWKTTDSQEQSISKHASFNLLLNRVFITSNHQTIDINTTNYYFDSTNTCYKNNNSILFNKNDINVTVLSLSNSKKLYFKECNATNIDIFAVKVISVKGKNIYKLVDIGYIEHDKKE